MPSATITSTASTFGTISGTFVDSDSTISGTISGVITGTLDGSVGVPGPGVPSGGLEGQILLKASDTSYDTVWADNTAETLTATVRNETGATLSKGTVVYITGAAGNKALVSKASASSEATSSKTFAILAEDILNNQNGTAVTVGLLKSLDTSALTEGGSLWLSTTAGQWTQTMPTAPNHAVFLGTVTRVHANQGTVEVRIQNGYELQELHNVKITSVSNGQVLKYDSAQSLWVNGTDSSGVAWGGITGTLSSQTDLQTALDAKLAKAGGVITGDIQSNNGSGYRSYDGAYKQTNVSASMIQLLNSDVGGNTLSIEWNGITFPSGKQTVHYPGTSILSGYATESWVTAGFYPLTGNPSGFLTSASLSGYATESWVTSQGYLTSSALTPYLLSSTAASTYQTLAGMSSYLTTSAAASTYYLQTNPAGYITSSALTGYATQAWVDAQGYLQAGALTGYALESWVTSQGYLTDAPSDGNQYARKNGAWDVVSAGTSYITSVTAPLAVTGSDLSIDLTGYATESWVTGQNYLTDPAAAATYETIANAAATYYPLSNPNGYITSSALSPYLTSATAASTYQTISGMSSYAPLASPTFTGVPAAPTPAVDTNTTQIATTAFVLTQAGSSLPLVNGTAAIGSSSRWSRQDHVHPTDTTRAAVTSPALSGTPTAPTAAADTNTTQIATTAYVVGQASSTTPANNGTAAVGTSLKYARADHVHATDTTRAPLASPTFTGTVTIPAGASISGFAPLASPAFTGTPSLPTGTTAVTQTAGNNTTAVATTAFVQQEVPAASTTAAGKVELATSEEAILGLSTTLVPSAFAAKAAIMSSDWSPINRLGFTATTSGTGAGCTINWTNMRYVLPSTGSTGHSYARTFGLSQFDQLFNMWGDDANVYVNFAKRIWISGRSLINLPTQANYVCRVSFGKVEASGVGDLAIRGIGWKYTCGTSQVVQLMVHNGTTLTTVNSSFTPTTSAFSWDIVSQGDGNVTLYINGSSVATTSAGPSTRAVNTQCLYQEEAVLTGTSLNSYTAFYGARGAIYVQR